MFEFDYLYPSYLRVASKHLTACRKILERYQDIDIPNYVCWEIYYLSGYIIEGCGIYAIYKTYEEWDQDMPINIKYDDRRINSRTKEMIKDFENETFLCYSKDTRYNRDYCKKIGYIKGHNIETYKSYLQYQKIGMPYLGTGEVNDKNVADLLDSWKSEIRYVMPTAEQQIPSDTIRNLMEVCSDIFNYVKNQI